MLEKPGGYWLFSKLVCFKAPYFSTIKPRFECLEPGFAKARIRKRRAVCNHLGTVHAIAMANLCEFVGGTLMEISIPASMRWIPRGMNIEYLAKANSDLIASCTIDDYHWSEAQDVHLSVTVDDLNQNRVAHATIPMYVSHRPEKS